MNAVLDAARRRWQLGGATAPGCSMLERFAQRDGTPLYVYSRPLIASRVAALRAELPDGLALLYAVKANPEPAVVGCVVPAFEGFHVFAGSGCLDARAIGDAQQATLGLACELAPFAPAPVRVLNLGGGFGVPCFAGDSPLALAALGANLRALAADAVRRLPGVRLALELGRYLVAEAGVYLTRVVDRKESRGRTFLIVDGGANHHWHATGALEGRRHLHFPLAVVGAEGRPVERVTLCGPLCAPHDTWAEDIVLPVAIPGDLVAVFQSGAYGASASPQAFLGKPPPAERLVEWPARQPADARIATSPNRQQETEHA